MNKNMKTVLICHKDQEYLNRVQEALEEKGFDVNTIDNAAELVPTGIRLHPTVIVADPDMEAFNEHDICKHLMQDMRIQLIMVVDKNSTARAAIGDCSVEDTVEMNTDLNDLANLITKHVTVHQ
jgi:DNA-binding NtrC family response regulator